jgi:hypothetical protein
VLGAFFDESGVDEAGGGSPYAVVAGHLYEKEAACELDETWRQQLSVAGLRYFRASEAAHCVREAKKITPKALDVLYRQLIATIRRNAAWSIGVAIHKDAFAAASSTLSLEVFPDPYCLATFACISSISLTAMRLGYPGPIQYVFENGHVKGYHADSIIREFTNNRDRFLYGGHSFQPKLTCRPLQASDILAWELRKRLADGGKRRPRKSYLVLSEDHYDEYRFDATEVDRLLKTADGLRENFKAKGNKSGSLSSIRIRSKGGKC